MTTLKNTQFTIAMHGHNRTFFFDAFILIDLQTIDGVICGIIIFWSTDVKGLGRARSSREIET